jgi:hypothetical protein
VFHATHLDEHGSPFQTAAFGRVRIGISEVRMVDGSTQPVGPVIGYMGIDMQVLDDDRRVRWCARTIARKLALANLHAITCQEREIQDPTQPPPSYTESARTAQLLALIQDQTRATAASGIGTDTDLDAMLKAHRDDLRTWCRLPGEIPMRMEPMLSMVADEQARRRQWREQIRSELLPE